MMDYKQLIEQDCREYRELLRMREEIPAVYEDYHLQAVYYYLNGVCLVC